jgi:hypothetical protein
MMVRDGEIIGRLQAGKAAVPMKAMMCVCGDHVALGDLAKFKLVTIEVDDKEEDAGNQGNQDPR